eukprot:TRINITY_DN2141_c0_g1_i10.p9 TRINITY_DN2141_c0_g1~~TRINITY_DN2141_c0_g1_i10.p9  ORF type:complete len:129 (+),score=2.72 TRINITY_DN2141_c0_g1_i10:1334-1720(+)
MFNPKINIINMFNDVDFGINQTLNITKISHQKRNKNQLIFPTNLFIHLQTEEQSFVLFFKTKLCSSFQNLTTNDLLHMKKCLKSKYLHTYMNKNVNLEELDFYRFLNKQSQQKTLYYNFLQDLFPKKY